MAVERRHKRSLSTENSPVLNLSWGQGQPKISFSSEIQTMLSFSVLWAQQHLGRIPIPAGIRGLCKEQAICWQMQGWMKTYTTFQHVFWKEWKLLNAVVSFCKGDTLFVSLSKHFFFSTEKHMKIEMEIAQKPEVVCNRETADFIFPVELLQDLVNRNLGSTLLQQLSSAAIDEEGGVGPISLPKRAETFGGFDSHQMNASKGT